MPERLKIKRLEPHFTIFDECSHDDKWHNDCIRDSLKDVKVIQPPVKVGKDGRYLTKCACWFECEGIAYEYDRRDFLYDLALLEAAELSMDTYRALLTIQRLNSAILSKKQKRLISFKAQELGLQNLRRESNKLLLNHPL